MSTFNILYHIETAHRTTSSRLDEANHLLNLLHFTLVDSPNYAEVREGIIEKLKEWKNKDQEFKDPIRIDLTPSDMIGIGMSLTN